MYIYSALTTGGGVVQMYTVDGTKECTYIYSALTTGGGVVQMYTVDGTKECTYTVPLPLPNVSS